jgi:division protein CdvB (Snf7/Vps24/ESCRT-III family)
MISNSWNKTEGESISQKVMGKVKPDEPLKNRIDFAQKKLQSQITKLSGINEKLQVKHDKIFEKCVNAQRNNKPVYAQAYAGELAQVRKMKNMVSGAKLSMEQVKLRLDTVSELGDVVVTLSPCMSIIKGLSPSLSGIMPEANASMQDLSQILGDVMSGSSVGMEDNFTSTPETNSDTLAILEEAHNVIAGQTKSSIPEVPSELKQQVAERKSDIFI